MRSVSFSKLTRSLAFSRTVAGREVLRFRAVLGAGPVPAPVQLVRTHDPHILALFVVELEIREQSNAEEVVPGVVHHPLGTVLDHGLQQLQCLRSRQQRSDSLKLPVRVTPCIT